MRIKRQEKYDSDVYKRAALETHGLKIFRGPSKVKPELAVYLHSLSPDKVVISAAKDEDRELLESLNREPFSDKEDAFEFNGTPKAKDAMKIIKWHRTYPRDRQVAMNALSHAGYACEADLSHRSFIRRDSDKYYTEPHHLVPLAFSDEFPVSLDVEENVVSLCSNCHNENHYGKYAETLITKLCELRKDDLSKAGIHISLRRLLEMYRLIQTK